jgi:hypothetical protein
MVEVARYHFDAALGPPVLQYLRWLSERSAPRCGHIVNTRISVGRIDFSFDQSQALKTPQHAAKGLVLKSCGPRQIVVPSLAACNQLEEHSNDPSTRNRLDRTFS